MQDHEFDTKAEIKTSLSRQAMERQAEEPEAQSLPSPQRDPLAQVSCRIGDTSCASAHASTLNRATASHPVRGAQYLVQLQRQYGNRYVQRVLGLSRKGVGEAEAAPEQEEAIQRARGGGQALDKGVQGRMESAFGADFSGVRVHTDIQADTLNRELNSRAFTTGQDIFFRQGAHNPGSSSGRELLAHELTHVVQQTGDEVRRKLTIGQPGDRYEQEADQVAQEIMQQEEQPVQRGSDDGTVVRRQVEEEEEEPVQAKSEDAWIQRQEEVPEEEEEPLQAKAEDARVHRQIKEVEEEEVAA